MALYIVIQKSENFLYKKNVKMIKRARAHASKGYANSHKVDSVYCFLSCNFYVVIKKKKKVIIEHPKTLCKLSKTIRQTEKVSKVGSGKISNGSLYSHTKK